MTDIAAVTKPIRETRWNVLGCPKLVNRSQPLVSRCSPYCEDMWKRHFCLTTFFPIVDICLSCKDSPTKLWDGAQMAIFGDIFFVPYFQRAACSTFQTCIQNSHLATPCVEVWQTSSLRPLRLGEKKKKKEEETTGQNVMSASATQGGHNKVV